MSQAPLAALAVQYWKLCEAFARELATAAPERVQAGLARMMMKQ